MDRNRLIAISIFLYVYLMLSFPLQTIIVSIILVLGFLFIRNLGGVQIEKNGDTNRRKLALREAKIYLSPYSDIWRNLRLSNKYCSLKLGYDGHTITAQDSINRHKTFSVIRSKVHSISDLWNMFCMSFNHNTTFDELIQLCGTFNVEIEVNGVVNNNIDDSINKTSDSIKIDKAQVINDKEKLDINNASEVEITALPGVSIVMAKKLIKKREEIGGFKSVKDVYLFLKVKPHIQTQLEQLICVKKMKHSGGVKRYNERSVDL